MECNDGFSLLKWYYLNRFANDFEFYSQLGSARLCLQLVRIMRLYHFGINSPPAQHGKTFSSPFLSLRPFSPLSFVGVYIWLTKSFTVFSQRKWITGRNRCVLEIRVQEASGLTSWSVVDSPNVDFYKTKGSRRKWRGFFVMVIHNNGSI